ncbi:hypothetical protein B0H21DRAFT_35411 [Amylocystis lapponica]|nr:hypothetical protein B0H21DRAFT_35411 [Amylocystis lapponica]
MQFGIPRPSPCETSASTFVSSRSIVVVLCHSMDATADELTPAAAGRAEGVEEPGSVSEPAAETSSAPISLLPAVKKGRHTPRWKVQRADDAPKTCYLAYMPLEILAEILSHTASPKDILALARCSKFFCVTLVNNHSTTFIWRHARAHCKPAGLPDPTPNFTEASYAAFIFDGGECDNCSKKTKYSHYSYMLRLRICHKETCIAQCIQNKLIPLPQDVPRYSDILAWIPRTEPCLRTIHELFRTTTYVKRSEWNAAVNEFNKAALSPTTMEEYMRKKQLLADRLPAVLEHADKLVKWKYKRDEEISRTRNKNQGFAAKIAQRHGWQDWELINSETYGWMHRSRSASFEVVTEADFAAIEDTVKEEMARNIEHRKRREAEAAYRKRREAVAKQYNRLKADKDTDRVLPTLPEFRKLSVMKVMQSKNSVALDPKNTALVAELLVDNLDRWENDARAALAGVLGCRTAGKTMLHPVDRLTARFQCKKCMKAAGMPAADGALTFAAACEHRCPHLTKKQRSRESWRADQFEPDQRAIDVVSQVLAQVGTSPEDTASLPVIQALGARVQCLSCPSAIVMDLEIAIRHSRRHDEVKFAVLPQDEANAVLQHPYKTGLTAQLMGHLSEAPASKDAKVYGCRHCHQLRASDSTSASATEEQVPSSREKYHRAVAINPSRQSNLFRERCSHSTGSGRM